jgi:hypothetical protein
LTTSEAVIPLLRFRAGAVPCAVAAREVRGLRGAPFDRPSLSQLLGTLPAADGAADSWVLRLAHEQALAEIVVQGPIEITDVNAGDVLRRPPALVLPHDHLIFGFARCAQELVILLDIPTLVELAA